MQESMCQKKLKNHENIVKLLATHLEEDEEDDDRDDKVALVLECCAGGNLADFLRTKGGKLKQNVINSYLLPQLRKGYSAMFNAKIIHRDIKLENIFLSKRDMTVIVPDPEDIIYK